MASPRPRAASMKMVRFDLAAAWPTNSDRVWGLRAEGDGGLLHQTAGLGLGHAQAHEGSHGLAGGRDRGGTGRGRRRASGAEARRTDRLALQFHQYALGELWAHPAGAADLDLVVPGHGLGQGGGGQDVQHRKGGLGPDPLHGLEQDKGGAVVRVEEAIEARARALRPLGLDPQDHGLASGGKARQGPGAAAHDPADPAHVDEGFFLGGLKDPAG